MKTRFEYFICKSLDYFNNCISGSTTILMKQSGNRTNVIAEFYGE